MTTLASINLFTFCPSIIEARSRRRCSAGTERLTIEQTAQIAASKQVIYDGFKAALTAGVPDGEGGHPGGRAVRRRYPAECRGRTATQPRAPPKRADRKSSISSTAKSSLNTSRLFTPTFCKVLVRYNPEGDEALNARQATRLKRLSDYFHEKSQSSLHVRTAGAAREGTTRIGSKGTRKPMTFSFVPELMVETIEQIQHAGVEPDVWKIEGLDNRRKDCENIVAALRRGGRDKVGCIILGRGEDDQKVREWLATASGVPGFIGFAVGRTSFWDSLVDWRAKKITRRRRGK